MACLQSSYQELTPEAGCDEAGRGCLAGPVFAAAVVLPAGYIHSLLNDSKQLTAKQRFAVRLDIERDALSWAVASCSPAEIDRINILKASVKAMHRAVAALSLRPAFLIIDGNYFLPIPGMPHKTLVKGDARFASIAAASVLAKTYRDEAMEELAAKYPGYGWERNKGYPTQVHREAIMMHGVTIHHRRSFRLLPEATLFDR